MWGLQINLSVYYLYFFMLSVMSWVIEVTTKSIMEPDKSPPFSNPSEKRGGVDCPWCFLLLP